MYIHTGFYNLVPKIVAFRSDYCRTCRCETIAHARRSLEVFHVYWVPIFPLGIWTRWFCTKCGKRPHDPTTVRRPIRVIVVVFFLLLSVLLWFVVIVAMFYPSVNPTDDKFAMIGAIVMSIRLFLSGYWAWNTETDNYKARLINVMPYSGHACPLCADQLEFSRTLTCRGCGAQHRPLQWPYMDSSSLTSER